LLPPTINGAQSLCKKINEHGGYCQQNKQQANALARRNRGNSTMVQHSSGVLSAQFGSITMVNEPQVAYLFMGTVLC